MPNDELTRSEYIRALLSQKKTYNQSGGNLVNPMINGLASLDTSFNAVQPMAEPEPVKEEKKSGNWFDNLMNNVLGFVDEIAAKFGAGFVNGWEGILDLGANLVGAFGDWTGWYNGKIFTDWAKQDIGATAAEWSKTAWGLGAWYNRFRNWDWDAEEWADIGKGFLDLSQAAFFAKNDLGDPREISNKHYKGNDEALEQMGGFGQFLGGAAHSIGFMLPSIMTGGAAAGAGVGKLGVQAISLGTMGLGAAGKGAEEALNEGANASQALGYGAASGALEVASEIVVGKALGLAGLGTGKVMGIFGGKAAKETAKVGSKAFVKTLAKTMFEEGMEEVFTAVLEPTTKAIYKGKDSFKDYGNTDFWFGTNGHFNESVLGQFTSGAFVGGLTGGIHEGAVYKKLGSDGYLTARQFANVGEADVKMSKLESSMSKELVNEINTELAKDNPDLSKFENNKQAQEYIKAAQERAKAMIDFIANEDKFLKNATEAQKQAFAEMLTNKNAVQKWMKEEQNAQKRTLDNFIKNDVLKYQTHSRAITTNFMNELNTQFGTDVELEFRNDLSAEDTAYFDKTNNKIVINDKYLDTEGGAKLAHEYFAHKILQTIPTSVKADIYKSIEGSDWYKARSKSIAKAYEAQKLTKEKLQEETLAHYLEEAFSGGTVATQINNLRSIFGNQSLLSKIERYFDGVTNKLDPKKTDIKFLKTYAKTVSQITKQLRKTRSNREHFAKVLEKFEEIENKLKEAINPQSQQQQTQQVAYSKNLNNAPESQLFDKNNEEIWYSKKLPDGRDAVQSPIVYQGSKYKIIEKVFQYLPNRADIKGRFIDAFSGSLTVSLNADFENSLANEYDDAIYGLQLELKQNTPSFINNFINMQIKNYDLRTLEGFQKYVELFNKESADAPHHWLKLLILQRFSGQYTTAVDDNGKFVFRSTAGYKSTAFETKKEFLEKLKVAHDRLQHIELTNKDALDIIREAKEGDFLYIDPPYSGTHASYNQYWDDVDDHNLTMALDEATERGVKWMMSNVFDYDQANIQDIIGDWAKNYEVKHLEGVKYQKGNADEVVIRNYNDKGEILNGKERQKDGYRRFEYDFGRIQENLGEYAQQGIVNGRIQDYLGRKWGLLYNSRHNQEEIAFLTDVYSGKISLFSGTYHSDYLAKFYNYLEQLQKKKNKPNPLYDIGDSKNFIKADYWTPEMKALYKEYEKLGGRHVYFRLNLTGDNAGAFYDPRKNSINFGIRELEWYSYTRGENGAYNDVINVMRHERGHYFQRHEKLYYPMFEKLIQEHFDLNKGLYEELVKADGHGDEYLKSAEFLLDMGNPYAKDQINLARTRNGLKPRGDKYWQTKTNHEIAVEYNRWMIRDEVMSDILGQRERSMKLFDKYNIQRRFINKIVNDFMDAVAKEHNIEGGLMFSKKVAKTTPTKTAETFKSIETTKDIVEQTRKYVEGVLGSNFKTFAPKNVENLIGKSFTKVNEVKDHALEARNLTNVILETSVEKKKKDGGYEYVGELKDLLSKRQIKSLTKAIESIIKSSPDETARSKATRIYELALNKAADDILGYKTSQSRVRVLTRLRDRARRNVGRFADITDDQISKSGLYALLKPFEELHGNDKNFSAKGFRENLNEALDWYNEDKLLKEFPDLPYSEEIRNALIDVYEALGSPKSVTLKSGATRTTYGSLNADVMQKAINAMRLIESSIREMTRNHIENILPSSQQAISALERSKYSKKNNPIAKLFRAYKRGFAPAYAVMEQIFGGNSQIVDKLVYEYQKAVNEKTLYTGLYHDKINKQLKDLKIKKNFDARTFEIEGHTLTADQLLGLYISLNVDANFKAIDEDGAVFFNQKTNKYEDLATKGNAQALKDSVANTLPDNYKKFGDWLLEEMNNSVKQDYMDWYEKRFGEFQMRNEIGAVGQNSYWMLNRDYQRMDNKERAVYNLAAIFSHAKHRTNGGGNAVLIGGALSGFDAYIDKLGSETYTKLVYRDAVATMNAKLKGEKSVMDILSKKVESSDIGYVRTTLDDMLGALKPNRNWLDRFVGSFSVAKLSLNLGSIFKQFASQFTSNIPIRKTFKAIANRMFNGEARKELRLLIDGEVDANGKYKKGREPIGGLKYREASKGILSANADTMGNVARQVAGYGMLGISKMDFLTVTTGVYSLMVIAQDQFNAKIGTQENIDFVREHWQEYELSQIGNTALSKNAISRGDSLARYLFGFLQGANRAALGSQIHKVGLWQRNHNVDKTQLQNDLDKARDDAKFAKDEYDLDPDDTDKRDAWIEAQAEVLDLESQLADYERFEIAGGKAIPVHLASGLLAQAILISLVNALMKRIKGKKDWDEWDIAEEGMNLAMALGVDWIPFVNFLSGIVQGYDVSVPAVDIFNQFSDIFSDIKGGNFNAIIRKIAMLLGDMTGVPLNTIYQYIYGVTKIFNPEVAYEMNSVLYGSSMQSANRTLTTYAEKGNLSKSTYMVDIIMKNYKTGSTTDEINRELAQLKIDGYNAVPSGIPEEYTNENGETVKLTAEQIEQFKSYYSQSTKPVNDLINLTDYKSATAEEKAKLIKKLYDIYHEYAKVRTLKTNNGSKYAKILALTNGNVNLAKYIVALQKVAQITDTKKKTKKELVLQYINKIKGFSTFEKTLLMYLAGYKVSGKSKNYLIKYLMSKGAKRKDVLAAIE